MQSGLTVVMSLPLILIPAQVGDSRASGFPAHIDALAAKVPCWTRKHVCRSIPSYNLRMRSRHRNLREANRRLTERRNPASKNLDRMSAIEIVRLMNREDHRVAAAVARELPAIARAADAIVQKIQQGGRLIYVGAGSSGRIAVLDASECPPTFGTPPQLVRALIAGGKKAVTGPVEGAEDRPLDAVRDLEKIRLSSRDALVGIAASGSTPYVVAAVAYAKNRKALTVAVSSNRNSPLEKAAKIAITPEVGAEVLTGSTRLKAGTAQKMVLNMLSTATMVRLGYVYDNLMIDLGIVNAKLRKRARQILEDATARDASAVEHALRQSKHDLRVALVMLKRGLSAKEASKRLIASGGHLRKALGE
jgi:N-acetylmuramic acid 6-phosphate etherase